MLKNEVTIKDAMTDDDMIAFVERVVSGFFQEETDDYENPTGKVLYTPYFRNKMMAALFVEYAIDGLEFDEDENKYLTILQDEELMDVYPRFMQSIKMTKQPILAEQIQTIQELIDDKLEVEKQKHIQEAGLNYEIKMLIRSLQDILNEQMKSIERQKQVETLLSPEEQAEFARKMANVNFDPNEIAKISTEMFYDKQHGEQHIKAIDHKNKILRKLHKEVPDLYQKVLQETSKEDKIIPTPTKQD